MDLSYEDSRKITRFSGYLRNTLTNQHSDTTTVVMVTKALGKLAKISGYSTSKTLTAEWVEFETKRALEWLEGDSKHKDDGRRYAAVLVLKELAENAPTLFYAHVATFLDHIWNGLRDQSVIVREGSVLALRAVLALISERRSTIRVQWYHDTYRQVKFGFAQKNVEVIHGSLLTLGELLRNTGNFMNDQFEEACGTVLRFSDHKDRVLRRTVISLIPHLAHFYKRRFNDEYLSRSLALIINVLKTSQTDKDNAFTALGELCLEVGPSIIQFEDQIFAVIKEGITPRKKGPIVPEALTALSQFGRAAGPTIADRVSKLLNQMFSSGLSPTLTAALRDLSDSIPSLHRPIQDRMLETVSNILTQSPHRPVNVRAAGTPVPVSSSVETNEQVISLALKTLGSMMIKGGRNLTDFVRDCVMNYLDDDNPVIRKEAAKTSCNLLVGQGTPPVKGHYGLVVGEVLEKLLTVGITDADPSIRYAVLSSLDHHFDHFLALSDNLKSLFIALNDENFNIREVAISIIGRLSTRNPAYVLPSLRKTLIQLLNELETSEDTRNKEESARMMGHLITAAPRLIKHYVPGIVKVLMQKISDSNQVVASCVLDTTGKLALVGGTSILPFMDKLLPLVIDTLQDQSSSSKRAVAVRTLGQLVESTGYVIAPYTKYPKLLQVLLQILKTEEEWITRREVIKTLGILGAIDPHRHYGSQLQAANSTVLAAATTAITDQDGMLDNIAVGADVLLSPSMGPSPDDYYCTVSFAALIKILMDPSLSTHHTAVIQAIMFIFTSLGMKCVPFLDQVIPPFLTLIRTIDPHLRSSLIQQLRDLVSIVKQHIRNYLDDIFAMIRDFWKQDYKLQIISLEEEICLVLNEEFKPYLPEVIPQLLSVLHNDKNKGQIVAMKVLHALTVFGRYLEDYLYLVIPAVVKLFELSNTTNELRISAIRTVRKLSKTLDFSEYSSRIIHPLSRVLADGDTELLTPAMDTLCALASQLGSSYGIFIPMITKIISKNGIRHSKYEEIIDKLMKNQPLGDIRFNDDDDDDEHVSISADDSILSEVKKMHVNQVNLMRAWEASQRATKEDWIEWLSGFAVELLRESPSPALRSCSPLAQVYHPLARELFNAGFVSCWTELSDKGQSEVVRALELAFSSPNLPPEVLQTLLNLAEFMEHDEKPLPIAITALGTLAEKCQAYAKALHYKEIEFILNPAALIEDLISINNQLQQHEAAMGILKYAQKNHSVELKESWYEKLQRWEEAYAVYEAKQRQNYHSISLTLGRMRCLKAMGEWEKLFSLCTETWNVANDKTKHDVAQMGAAAAWNLGQWEFMQECVSILDQNTSEYTFFKAVLAIHNNKFDDAHDFIDRTRLILDRELAALVGESYNRAYDVVVRVQQLSEMEEIVKYKRLNTEGDPEESYEKQLMLRRIWGDRLMGIKRNVDHWQNILSVRKLVVSPEEDIDVWLKFASLCRKSNKLKLSLKTLKRLISDFDPMEESEMFLLPDVQVYPRAAYQFFKHLWCEKGQKKRAFDLLSRFVNVNEQLQSDPALMARCLLTLGKWQQDHELVTRLEQDPAMTQQQILANLKAATEYDSNWYRAWHSWALMNSEVVAQLEQETESTSSVTSPSSSPGQAQNDTNLIQHLVFAIHGFFRSISLSPDYSQSLQDILRLLTLWFKHGAIEEAESTLYGGFDAVNIDTWLHVIPQIIARINSHVKPIRQMIHELLAKVGKAHPQALIYPLTVSSKSQATTRKTAAQSLLNEMRQHNSQLVEQALMVSNELIRVAILWNEMWHEGLEDASRLYFGENDVEGMFQTLAPLHRMMRTPETLSEISFTQQFGRDLQEAQEWCKKYRHTRDTQDISSAWDLYYHVFRKLVKQLHHMIQHKIIELQYVSPRLLEANRLELAVPGTYRPESLHSSVVNIASFSHQLRVMNTKQRPRVLNIHGIDGKEYRMLLKGHEDLRQDERVMQLFGLVNTLLNNDPETATRDLSIKRYAVIPLSSNAGLIEWVDHCDTLHMLIKEYRENRNILLNVENRQMLQLAGDIDNLTTMQKIEVFEHALENTSGQDLYKVLWLKSRSSEVWLYRRTNYTRSLAVMSMVGYILGLGDRHPSNIMLEKLTGKIVHIDFGDCFAGDTPVALQCGLARRIDSLHSVVDYDNNNGTTVINQVMSCDDTRGEIINANQVNFLRRGERDLVQLTLEDGRTLRCTPEHKFLTVVVVPNNDDHNNNDHCDDDDEEEDDEQEKQQKQNESYKWVEAKDLLLTSDDMRIVVGPELPLDEPGAQDEMGYMLQVGTFTFDTTSMANRDRLLAFARIVGAICGDGSINDERTHFSSGHNLDEEQFMADVQLVAPQERAYVYDSTENPNIRHIVLPPALHKALCSLKGLPSGKRVEQEATLPEFVINEKCPVAVVREFLGGLFGAGGWAPQLLRKGMNKDEHELEKEQEDATNSGDEMDNDNNNVDVKQTVKYSLHGVKISRHIVNEFSNSLRDSLLSVAQLLARVGVSGANVSKETRTLRNGTCTDTLEWRLVVPSDTKFAECVGFRYCAHKNMRLAAATAYWRLLKTVRMQGDGNPIRTVNSAIKPEEFMKSIGVYDWFVQEESTRACAVSSRATGLPTMRLRVMSRISAGREYTYDISIEQTHSFLANGVVAHNCFETAMHRDKFPEKVPFRLTRMLVNAMEVCGIEGTFRSTCESVMRVLRENKDSVMAMLEAFVYDPLINWRLLEATAGTENDQASTTSPAAPHTMSIGNNGALVDPSTSSWVHSSRSVREKELRKSIKNAKGAMEEFQPDVLNKRALSVITRVSKKLTGRDFEDYGATLSVEDQVEMLIQQATSHANLARHYVGWCSAYVSHLYSSTLSIFCTLTFSLSSLSIYIVGKT